MFQPLEKQHIIPLFSKNTQTQKNNEAVPAAYDKKARKILEQPASFCTITVRLLHYGRK